MWGSSKNDKTEEQIRLENLAMMKRIKEKEKRGKVKDEPEVNGILVMIRITGY
jgi:hypothetical protein